MNEMPKVSEASHLPQLHRCIRWQEIQAQDHKEATVCNAKGAKEEQEEGE